MPTPRSRDARVGVDLEAVVAAQALRARPARALSPGAEREAALGAEQHVLEHRERLDQHEVLVDHADAGGDGVLRAADRRRPAVDQDLAAVGLVDSRRGCSSGSTCRRRSRRRCRGSIPRRTTRTMSRLACTAPKHLSMPRSSTAAPGPTLRGSRRRRSGQRHWSRHVVGDLDLAGDDVGVRLLAALLHVRGDQHAVVLVDARSRRRPPPGPGCARPASRCRPSRS